MAKSSQANRTGCEDGTETGEVTIIDEIFDWGSLVSSFLTGTMPVRRFCSSVT